MKVKEYVETLLNKDYKVKILPVASNGEYTYTPVYDEAKVISHEIVGNDILLMVSGEHLCK